MDMNKLSEIIISAAIDVHRELGPGLLESTYEACLAYELLQNNIKFEQQKPLPVKYKGIIIECGYRLDFLVEDKIILELKAVEDFNPIHKAQLLTYLKLTNLKVGLLINFNVKLLKNGITRLVN